MPSPMALHGSKRFASVPWPTFCRTAALPQGEDTPQEWWRFTEIKAVWVSYAGRPFRTLYAFVSPKARKMPRLDVFEPVQATACCDNYREPGPQGLLFASSVDRPFKC